MMGFEIIEMNDTIANFSLTIVSMYCFSL